MSTAQLAARRLTLGAMALAGLGLLLTMGTLANIQLAQAIILGMPYTGPPGWPWSSPVASAGIGLVAVGLLGGSVGGVLWAGVLWVEGEGGSYRVRLVSRARAVARRRGVTLTEATLAELCLRLEHEGDGWRPDTIAWWLDTRTDPAAVNRDLLLTVQAHVKSLRLQAEDAMTRGALDPRVEAVGTAFDAADLATLCDRLNDRIWALRVPADRPTSRKS